MNNIQSPEQLFEQVVSTDDYKAFEFIFNKYYNFLCNYALKFVVSPDVAEEVVSDVFYKVWKNRKKIVIKTSFESYLFRAVKNQSLDFLKSKANQNLSLDDVSPVYERKADMTPEDTLMFQELEGGIEDAIESLPPKCKRIFKSSRFQGLKYAEIADKYGISVKTVETQMGRALSHLRNAVRREEAYQ
jgi:RNA polymerase sigma-70 factor (ECF subfamily)